MTRAAKRRDRAALVALALCAAACGNQEPDVVASIQYLDASTPEVVDAGNPLDLPSAEPGVCSGRVLAIHSVLSRVGSDCKVPSDTNPQTQIALLSLLATFAPAQEMLPGEVTGISYCDRWEQMYGRPLVVYWDNERNIVLCPSYCASVLQWVAENNPMVLACLERGQ